MRNKYGYEYEHSQTEYERDLEDEKQIFNASVLGIFMLVATIILCIGTCTPAHAYTDKEAINACIGEAEGESYLGKIAISATIINRGTLKGVYGGQSQRVLQHKYSRQTYNDCKAAWEYAKSTYGTSNWKATGWGTLGDIQQFKREGWFKDCVIVAHLGKHYFYREAK